MNSNGFSHDKSSFTGSANKKKVNFDRQEPLHEDTGCSLTAVPSVVSFANYQPEQLYISKFTVRNCSARPVNYKLVPPKQTVFTVKYEQKLQLESEQTLEVYVYFKSQRTRVLTSYNDKAVFVYDGGSLTIELFAKPPIDPRRFSLVLCEDDQNTPYTTFKKRLVSSKLTSAKRVGLQKTITDSEMILDDGHSDGSEMSQKFLQKYRQLWESMKQRKTLIHTSAGNEPLSKTYIEEVLAERRVKQQKEQYDLQCRTRNRFKIYHSDECPIIDRGQNKIVRWNESLNDMNKIKMNGTKKLLACVWRYITSFRVERAKKVWQKYLNMNGSHQEVMHRIRQDIELASKNSRKIKVECRLEFHRKMLQKKELPVELGKFGVPPYNGACFVYEVNPRIGFDDWIPMEEICENYEEMMGYDSKVYPNLEMANAVVPEVFTEARSIVVPSDLNRETLDAGELGGSQLRDIEFEELPELTAMSNYSILSPSEIDSPLELFEIPSPWTDQSFEPANFLSEAAQITTGINIELCQYIRNRTPCEFDCGFHQYIEQQVDHTIGEPELDDQLRSDWIELPPQTERLLQLCLHTQHLEPEWFQPLQPNQEYSLYQLIQHELYLLKTERLRQFNAYIRSYNKFIRSREHKLIF